jgi:hypothetical protein
MSMFWQNGSGLNIPVNHRHAICMNEFTAKTWYQFTLLKLIKRDKRHLLLLL